MNAADRPPVCSYEGSDYQQTFWEQGGRAYEDRVEAVALRRLLPASGKLLLELGAGAGRNTPRYQGFERVVLLDYSLTQLQQAQERLGRSGRYIYAAADIYRLPFAPGVFDAATMIRTLHHLVDIRRALAQVQGALQPGATFILEFANKRNIKAIVRYLLRRQSWSPFTLEAVEFAKLNYDFHPRVVRACLEEAGFRIERQLTVSHFRIGVLKRTLPVGLLVWLDSLAQLTGDWWQLSPSVFVRARCSDQRSAVSGQRSAVGDQQGLFACAECGHFPLDENPAGLNCPACGRGWAIKDGIYDFRQAV